MPHLTKMYILRRKEKNFKKIFSTEKMKTGGLVTCKTFAISAPFCQKTPPILCTNQHTVSASKTLSNELRIDTQKKTPLYNYKSVNS